MLASLTSRELSEWSAYERAYGPIDNDWRDETLAQIHELMQDVRHLTARRVSTNGVSTETVPKRRVRPAELWEEYKRREVIENANP